MKSYSTFLFDVGGTLIRFASEKRAQAYVDRALKAGITVEPSTAVQILDALDLEIPERQKDVPLSLLPGTQARAFWVDFWAEGFRRMGLDEAASQTFAEELLDPVNGGNFQAVFDDVIPTLEGLTAQGKQLGVVSNFSRNCEDLLRQLGLAHYFDFFVVSGIVGIEKPNPRIFEIAVAAAAKPQATIVYVGDSVYHDVEGAQRAGLDAILLDRANRFPDFDGKRITSLLELIQSVRLFNLEL